jgi:hypothetical protein
MPESAEGFKYIVFARDDLSGWVEGHAIQENNSETVAKFLFEDVIARHGCPERIVVDGGPENKRISELSHYKIKRTLVSAYHPQANGLVERGYQAIVNAIAKYCNRHPVQRSQQKGLAEASSSRAMGGQNYDPAVNRLSGIRVSLRSGLSTSYRLFIGILEHRGLGRRGTYS